MYISYVKDNIHPAIFKKKKNKAILVLVSCNIT